MKLRSYRKSFFSAKPFYFPELVAWISVSIFVLFALAPILCMLVVPFFSHPKELNLGNWLDSRQLVLVQRSLGIAAGTTLLSLFISVPYAFLVHRTRMRGRKFFEIAYLIPALIPPYIHAIVWNRLNPWIKNFLHFDLHSVLGVVWVSSLAYFPFLILLVSSGLRSIDPHLEEVSVLIRGRCQTFRRITVSLLIPNLIAGAVFIFVFSLIDFGVPDLLRLNVYPVEIFIQFSAFYDEAQAAILSLPLVAVTISLLVIQKWFMGDRSYVQSRRIQDVPASLKAPSLNAAGLFFCTLVIGVSVVLPISVLLVMAGSLATYVQVLGTSHMQIAYSLAVSGCGAAASLLLALPLAHVLRRMEEGKRKIVFWGAIFLPLAIPAATFGLGLIRFWNQSFLSLLYNSSFLLLIGCIGRFASFAVLVIHSGLERVHPHLEEAACLANSSWLVRMKRILMPLLTDRLWICFLIVFILSLGDLGMSLLIMPAGRETIPIKIYNLIHYGADSQVAALSVSMIAVILAGFGLVYIALKCSAKRRLV